MIQKHQTACCALCQLTASNEDSYEDLIDAIGKIQESADKSWTPANRSGGERAIFVIVAPGEDNLRNNLIKLNFKKTVQFNRRNGYPIGKLEMYMGAF